MKIAPPAEKKFTESREETHQPTHVVNHIPRDDKDVVRKIKQPKSREPPCPSSAGVVL